MDTEEQRSEQLLDLLDSARQSGRSSADTPLILPAFKQRLDLLTHLLANSDRIPVVCGSEGSGKSTLLRQLQQSAPADWRACQLSATPMLQSGALFKALSGHFSLPQRRLENPNQLLRRFEDLNQAGSLPVLMVDDAEQLSLETLVNLLTLFNQASEAGIRFSVALFATPAIEALLTEAAARLGTNHSLLLPQQPLDFEQTGQLAQHIWKALAPGKSSLGIAELERVFETSRGVPVAIREQLTLLAGLHVAGDLGRPSKRVKLPHLFTDVSVPAVVGGVVLAILILLTLIYEDEINALFAGGPDTPAQLAQPRQPGEPIPIPIPNQSRHTGTAKVEAPADDNSPVMESVGRNETAANVPRSAGANLLTQVVRPVPAVNLPLVVPEPKPDADPSGEAGTVAEKSDAEKPESEKFHAPPIEQTLSKPVPPEMVADEKGAPQAVVPKSPSGSDSSAAPVVARVVAPESRPAATQLPQAVDVDAARAPATDRAAPIVERSSRLQSASGVASVPEPESVIASGAEQPKAAPVVARPSLRTEQWLKRQPASRYTLQLLALSTEEAALNYLKKHGLQENAAYFRMERKGQSLYPVLYGSFESRDAANAARQSLPAGVNRSTAWPRSFGSVHDLIK
ncbi:MAG: AAA family ATPase [Gammaproteobacteria bacterium]|nr:AAA family ATPase [Gammaproteobacteria bacterium]